VGAALAGAAVDAPKWRSGLERSVGKCLEDAGVEFSFESTKVKYTVPATQHTYLTDFELPDGVFLETKGRFTSKDRKKMLLVREQHPNFDFVMVFPKPNNKLRKGSPTTYAQWCDNNKIRWISLADLVAKLERNKNADFLRRRKR
jgi:hypothetical protein